MPAPKTQLADFSILGDETNQAQPFHTVPMDWIALDEPLSMDLYIHIVDRKILFRREGDVLTSARVTLLRKQGVDSLYVTSASWEVLLEEMARRLRSFNDKEHEVSFSWLRAYILAFMKNLEITKDLDSHGFSKILGLGDFLAHSCLKNPPYATELLRRYADTSLYYANHNVNTGLYSAVIGMKWGLNEAELKELTLAGLTHNVGNLLVPDAILNKPDKLTPEEWAKVQMHPVHGANYLESLSAPKIIIAVAREHHEQPDGKGYPYKLKNHQIHPYSKIVAVADVYDALTNRRPHVNSSMGPAAAIRMMQTMEGKFDVKVFKTMEKLKK